jgi:hypothetical protein
MNKEDILRLAREADLVKWLPDDTFLDGCWLVWDTETTHLERFAALVVAHEREACAKVCEAFGKTLEVDVGDCFAEKIRARSEQ